MRRELTSLRIALCHLQALTPSCRRVRKITTLVLLDPTTPLPRILQRIKCITVDGEWAGGVAGGCDGRGGAAAVVGGEVLGEG
jgi:hypothetical protein